MNIKQAIKNIFSKLFTSSKPKEIPPIETVLTDAGHLTNKGNAPSDKEQLSKLTVETKQQAEAFYDITMAEARSSVDQYVGRDTPSVDGHINALAEYPNIPVVRDPMVEVYQDVRAGLGLRQISDLEAGAKLVRHQQDESVRIFHDPEPNDGFNERMSDIGKGMQSVNGTRDTMDMEKFDQLVKSELRDNFGEEGVADLPTYTPESVLYDTGFDDGALGTEKYLTDPSESVPRKIQNSSVSGRCIDPRMSAIQKLPVAVEAPLQKPSFIQRPTKKLNRAEKKQLKAIQQQENLKLQRAQQQQRQAVKKTKNSSISGGPLGHVDAPLDLSFATAVMQNNVSISKMIEELEADEFKPVARYSPPGVIVPEVSTIMGDEYGPRYEWTHKDDLFISFKILTRIVVSDPIFFSKYLLRTLPQEELTQYSAYYSECFVAIEELAPVADLGALAIMDKERYCILVAFQNVFGMLIVSEDDAIDIKRRSAGFEDPHATGYYHMTFMRFDHEALIRMDLVGRTEYGYAEQIPSFKVNFAKFDHSETE